MPEANSLVFNPLDDLGSILVVAPAPRRRRDPDRVHDLAPHDRFEVLAEFECQEVGEHVGGVVAVDAGGAGPVDQFGRPAVVEAGGHRGQVPDRDLAEPIPAVLGPVAAELRGVHAGLVVEPDQPRVDCQAENGGTEGGLWWPT